MANKEIGEFYHYIAARNALAKQRHLAAPNHTTEQVWDAAYTLDTPSASIDWYGFMNSGKFSPIPLGKLYGEHELWLLVAPDILDPCQEIPLPNLSYSNQQDILALSYPDGHPSTAEIRQPDSAQEKLRSFADLGWIAQESGGHWIETGHVLVIDMEPGRDRQPWIVLAERWPEDSESADIEGDEYQ